MVGRLVEQQHVGFLQQYLGQFYPHAPAAGKFSRPPLQIGALVSESEQRPFQFALASVGSHHQVPLVLGGVAFHQLHVLLALIVGTLAQLSLQLLHVGFQVGYVCKGFLGFLADGRVVLQVHHLRQVAYGAAVGYDHVTRCRRLLPTEYF